MNASEKETLNDRAQSELTVKPQYLTFLVMIYVTFSLIGCAVLYKIIKIDFIVGAGGLISLPIVLLMEDIIAEVYGYKISRRLLWYVLISQLIFTFLVVFIVRLPSPSYFHGQVDYNYVFSGILTGVPAMVFAIFLGRFLNLYVITKTKIMCKGRHFWLRSIFSSLAGDLVTLTVLYALVFHSWPFSQMSHFYLSDLLDRVFYSILGGGPALLVVMYLKKKENLDVYDYSTNFNPFKTEI